MALIGLISVFVSSEAVRKRVFHSSRITRLAQILHAEYRNLIHLLMPECTIADQPSERQRFATRIGRSAEFMKTSATTTTSHACCADALKNGDKPCCVKPSECCSVPDANP